MCSHPSKYHEHKIPLCSITSVTLFHSSCSISIKTSIRIFQSTCLLAFLCVYQQQLSHNKQKQIQQRSIPSFSNLTPPYLCNDQFLPRTMLEKSNLKFLKRHQKEERRETSITQDQVLTTRPCFSSVLLSSV